MNVKGKGKIYSGTAKASELIAPSADPTLLFVLAHIGEIVRVKLHATKTLNLDLVCVLVSHSRLQSDLTTIGNEGERIGRRRNCH